MKNILEYITEAMKSERYGTLVHHVEINPQDSEDAITKLLTDALEETITKYKVVRIKTVEEITAKKTAEHNETRKKDLEKAEANIIKLMQSKPGILKRKPEKRQEWINKKLKEYEDWYDSSEYHRLRLPSLEFNDDYIYWGWRNDIHKDHSYTQYRGMRSIKTIVKDIARYISRGQKANDEWAHLKSLEFATNSFIDSLPQINIIPVFDEETEASLDDSLRKHSEYMDKMYKSGKYMGD